MEVTPRARPHIVAALPTMIRRTFHPQSFDEIECGRARWSPSCAYGDEKVHGEGPVLHWPQLPESQSTPRRQLGVHEKTVGTSGVAKASCKAL